LPRLKNKAIGFNNITSSQMETSTQCERKSGVATLLAIV
jgi:hypothetical protein